MDTRLCLGREFFGANDLRRSRASRHGKRFVAGLEKKSQRTRLRERPPRVGQEKSTPLSVPFAQLNRKTLRWEKVSQALCVIKKARSEHDLAFWAK